MEKSKLDLVIAGTEDAILMIEGYCDFLTEEQVLEAIQEGQAAIRTICQGLAEWRKSCWKTESPRRAPSVPSEELNKEIRSIIGEDLNQAYRIKDKTAPE